MRKLSSSVLAACVVVALVISIGCKEKTPEVKSGDKEKNKQDSGGSPEAKKLAKDVVGNWANDKASYSFQDSGDYQYKSGNLSLKGKWKALDAKTISMVFTLTKADVEAMKPAFDLAKKGIDEANKVAKELADKSGGFITFKAIPYPPEPKEGDNTWTETVVVKGEEAEISGAKYKRRLGTTGPFEQTGKFLAEVSGTGEVHFPVPYAEPPDVELKRFAGLIEVKIVKLTKSGFEWQNTGKDTRFGHPEMTFIAKGIPVAGAEQTPFEQKGAFKATLGASGEEKFATAYASQPHVELSVEFGMHSVRVTETTAAGFKWKNLGTDKNFPDKNMKYAARGVKTK